VHEFRYPGHGFAPFAAIIRQNCGWALSSLSPPA